MNKQDRIELIQDAQSIIDVIKDSEQDKFDNLSEGLQQTERGQKFEETVSTLDDVISQLEEAMDGINTATE